MGRILSHYEIVDLVGRGGMSEVYLAVDISGKFVGRSVAIKRLLPAFARDGERVRLFTDEAHLSRELSHPGIVKVYEICVETEPYFIVMEYVDGRDLRQVLRRCRARSIRLPVDIALYLAVSLLDALGYAHTVVTVEGKPVGIVHCDVSPSNLFVSRVGEVKLGDFGIACVRTEAEAGRPRLLGKPYYLSPEMLDGQVDFQADLWAAATTLYELLSNERPFTGADPDDVACSIRRATPKPLREIRPDVPERLERVVLRGLARDREDRYPDASAFASELRPLLDERIGNPMAIAAVVRGLFGA